LYQSSRWPPDLKSQCSLGPRKELECTILFSQKVPSSESPPGSPVGPLWREIPTYRALLYLSNISFGVPSKGALPPGAPHGAPGERCPIPRALLQSSFKVSGI